MSEPSLVPTRKLSAEVVAILAIGVTVLLAVFAQAAWLDGKIERLGTELRSEIKDVRFEIRDLRDDLGARIEALQTGQTSLDKRLAVVESHVLGVPPVSPAEIPSEPAS